MQDAITMQRICVQGNISGIKNIVFVFLWCFHKKELQSFQNDRIMMQPTPAVPHGFPLPWQVPICKFCVWSTPWKKNDQNISKTHLDIKINETFLPNVFQADLSNLEATLDSHQGIDQTGLQPGMNVFSKLTCPTLRPHWTTIKALTKQIFSLG